MEQIHEVGGVEFVVISEKLNGWHVFGLLKKVRLEEDDFAKVDALIEIACYITGLSVDEFIAKCGGEDVPVADVVSIATELITKAYPKN